MVWLCSRQSFRGPGSFCSVALPLQQVLLMLTHTPLALTISEPASPILNRQHLYFFACEHFLAAGAHCVYKQDKPEVLGSLPSPGSSSNQ